MEERYYDTIQEAVRGFPGTLEKIYKYTDPDSNNVDLVVVRFLCDSGKTFTQLHKTPRGYAFGGGDIRPLYNRARIKTAARIVVVEGEKCVHALHSLGIVATTAPGGANAVKQADWTPLKGKEVIVWRDNDKAGEGWEKDVIKALSSLRPAPTISIVTPPLDLPKSDAADLVEQGGDCAKVVAEAVQVEKSSGVLDRINNIIEGKFEVVPFPWPKLTELTQALYPGTLTLFCGTPGASKSFSMLQCLKYWRSRGISCALYALEEDTQFHLLRLAAQETGRSCLLDVGWVRENPDEARRLVSEAQAVIDIVEPHIWAEPDVQPTLDDLSRWVSARAPDNRVLVLDPITVAAKGAQSWNDDSRFIQSIKNTVRDTGSSVILVTHPRKGYRSKDDKGEYIRPEEGELSGGADYGRFCQTILWLEYFKKYRQSWIETPQGRTRYDYNRIVDIIKGRNGDGMGEMIACQFRKDLALTELGIVRE